MGFANLPRAYPRASPVPSQIRGARGSWDTASPMHGLVPRVSGMTNTPPMICTPYLTHIPRVLGPTPNGSFKNHYCVGIEVWVRPSEVLVQTRTLELPPRDAYKYIVAACDATHLRRGCAFSRSRSRTVLPTELYLARKSS